MSILIVLETSGEQIATNITRKLIHELHVFIDGLKTQLKKGDMFSVPGGIPHCIQMLSARVRIIDSFSPLRNEFLQ